MSNQIHENYVDIVADRVESSLWERFGLTVLEGFGIEPEGGPDGFTIRRFCWDGEAYLLVTAEDGRSAACRVAADENNPYSRTSYAVSDAQSAGLRARWVPVARDGIAEVLREIYDYTRRAPRAWKAPEHAIS